MKRPLKLIRPFAVIALSAAAGFGAAACTSVERDAARVDNSSISVRDFDGIITDLLDARPPDQSVPNSKFSANDSRRILQSLIVTEIGKNLLENRKLPLTPEQLAAAESGLSGSMEGFSESLKRRQIEVVAVDTALQALDPQEVAKAVSAADVWINPSYGTWDPNVGISPLSDVAPPDAGE